jgi:glycosyltransferase involved in cell wall biosynthesis
MSKKRKKGPAILSEMSSQNCTKSRTVIRLFFVVLPLLCFGLEKRATPLHLKPSVIIPCHPDHFPLLDRLLATYKDQTRRPDEVIVSLSESVFVSADQIEALEGKDWGFALKLMKHKGRVVPGGNRNAACQAATGDLILCQDADDLPHPQRVEIIASLFENYEIDHLIHQWIPTSKSFETVPLDHVEELVVLFRHYATINIDQLHNGSVCFLRDVFSEVHWRPIDFISEDVTFNQHAYALCKNKGILKLPLIQYRFELSTFDLEAYKK